MASLHDPRGDRPLAPQSPRAATVLAAKVPWAAGAEYVDLGIARARLDRGVSMVSSALKASNHGTRELFAFFVSAHHEKGIVFSHTRLMSTLTAFADSICEQDLREMCQIIIT